MTEGKDAYLKPFAPKGTKSKPLGGLKDDKTSGKGPLKGVKNVGARNLSPYKKGK